MACLTVRYLFICLFLMIYDEIEACENSRSKTLKLRDDDGLPYYYFQGTSYSPESSNKNINKNSPDGATWCPDKSKIKNSFLEVDLGKQHLLRGVSTQGDSTYGFTKSYEIEISSNRIKWKFYQKNGTDLVFKGNENSTSVVYHPLNLSSKARFVRFYPDTYENNACMRVELYGEEIKKEKCEKTVIDASVPEIVVTAFPNISAAKVMPILNGTEPWCWSSNSTNPYLKVDFGNYSVICAMRFSFNGRIKLSYGNESSNTSLVIHGSELFLPVEKILTNFLQFKPIGNSSCLSVKMFGYLNEDLLNEDIGFQYRKSFPDDSFATSSWQFDTYLADPPNGRLYKPWKFWCSNNPFKSFYLELVLVQKYYVFAVSIHGKLVDTKDFKTEFGISYSQDYAIWYKYDGTFSVNFNNQIGKHSLTEPFTARIVRITRRQQFLIEEQCITVELHGIIVQQSSEYCGKPHPLGLSFQIKDQIPDDSIKVSSQLISSSHARLRDPNNSWCATASTNEWIRLDLGQVVSISGVATQGSRFGKVTEYEIRYSYDGKTWYGYPNNASLQTFSGNLQLDEDDAIFANWLNISVITRHIELGIQKRSSDRNILCLRLELYGCKEDVAMPVIEQKSDKKLLNRVTNTTIVLKCQIRGQAGMNVSWNRNGQVVQESSFEKISTEYPQELVLSAVTKTQINITYKNDRDIYNMFNCTGNKTNSRRLVCRSIYSCSATYPGANTSSQGRIPVIVTPDIVLPDVPRQLSINNTKSRSAVINWNAANDYLESRLEKYLIQVSNGSSTMRISVTSGIKWKNQTYRLEKLTEYTSYKVSIAAESAVAVSSFAKEVTFLTLYGPYITLNVSNVKKVEVNDKDITIPCTGKSYPTPDVIWKKDGKEIQLRDNSTGIANLSVYQIITPSGWDNKSNVYLEVTSTLFLRPNGIKYEDHGNYTCEVLNKNEGSIPLTKTVEVQFLPRITKRPNDTTINEGEDVSLTCDAEGPPKPTFTWSNVSEKVTIERIISKNNRVELQNVRSVGRYNFIVICIASNKGGSTTANATIEILVKPRIIKLTASQTALLYDNVTLVCEILANPAAQVWWTKDGNKSHHSNVEFNNDNKTLVITKAQLKNIGNYSCYASNNLSSTNESLRLNFKALPKAYIIGGEIKKLREGEKNSSITCLGYGYPNPKATWKIKNTEIPFISNSSVGSGVYQHRSSNDSVLKNVTSVLYFNQSGSTYEDFGNYTCEVSIEQASDDTDSEVARVIFYPIVLIGPRNKTVLLDENVRFDCKIDGRPNPSTSWLFNNQIVSTNHIVLSNGSLLLYSAQNNDLYEGEYLCYAENEAGQSEKSKSYLAVHAPAKILNISETEIHQLMANVILTCNVEGDPRPSISWTKANDSSPLSPPKFELSNYDQTLKIINVSLQEQGTYICKARNKYAVDERNVTVNVGVSPRIVDLTASSNTTNGETYLKCDAQGIPSPKVWWTKDGSFLNDSNGNIRFEDQNRTVVIISARPSDSGTYYCHARNKLSYVRRAFILNLIFLPRTFYISKSPFQLYNWQKNLRFACAGSGHPNIRVAWIRNGSEISSSANSTRIYQKKIKFDSTTAASVLRFKEVYCHDAGKYTCKSWLEGYDYVDTKYIELNCSSNFNQSTVTTSKPQTIFTTLTTQETTPVPPNVFVEQANPTAIENSSIILSCYCGCSIQPQWFKNNQLIYFNQSQSQYTLLVNGSLHISVSRYTAGHYSCEIRTSYWNVRSEQVKLEVWYLDDNYVTGEQRIYEGQNISLTCNGSGNPYPTFKWYLDGRQLKISSRIIVQENQLNIFNATTKDGGNYACVVFNKAGQVSHTVDVTIEDIPSIEMLANIPKYIVNGTAVKFTCQWMNLSHIDLISKMQLTKDGICFHQWLERKLVGHTFTTMFPARVSHTGRYQCKGTIGAASRYSSPFYLVVGIPSGPVVLEKSETSTTGIKLSWKPVSKTFWNGELVKFKVDVFSEDDKLQKSSVTKATSAIISGLRPATTYTVNITGSTVFGLFEKAAVIVVKTKENKNSIKFQLRMRLTNFEFSNNLLDATSSQYKNLKSKLEQSLDDIYKKSDIKFHYIKSTISGFARGSVVVLAVVSLDTKFESSSSKLAQKINEADTIAGYRFDRSYTKEEDFDECQNADFNTCHEYAHCENDVGTYICTCFEGFFGDGEECQGPPQITSKSPRNITQLVETNVTLVCTVIANPKPTISWKRSDPDGKFDIIKRTTDKSDGNYSIYNARLEDSGKYLCNVSNKFGYDSYITEITIKPEIVNISVEIKLSNKTFKEELKNKSSPDYKELEKDVYVELYTFFNNTPGFEDIEILEFVEGSVKVIFRVIVKVLKPSKETNDVVAVKVGRKISKQLKTGRIGNILVVPEAIQLRVPPPPPANVTYSDVRETRVLVHWKPPELDSMFSIKRYYITYLKRGEKEWFNNTINADQETNFQVDNLQSETFYTLKIIAENNYGLGKESRKMQIKTMKVKVVSPWYWIAPVIAVACFVLLVTIIFFVRRVSLSRAWRVRDRNFYSNKVEQKMSFQMIAKTCQNENAYANLAFLDTLENPKWTEFPRTSIEISNKTLVSGEFGTKVVRGNLMHSLGKNKRACSVKMLNEKATKDDRADLMNELSIISGIPSHKNIVNLHGACTSEDGPLLLVLEFCARGTLESNLKENEKNLFMKKTKIGLAHEIAKGMRHLADARIVHPDLAARNILMTGEYTPKISNFGLSRDIYERGVYHNLTPGKKLSRWSAIEALTDGLYTTKSDVWSFAVVMWEIETEGCLPYTDFDVTDLCSHINKGYRLYKPKETSRNMYKLMLQCWDANPDNRPTFHEIADIIERDIGNDQSFVNVSLTN